MNLSDFKIKIPLMEAAVTLQKFKDWLDNPVGFEHEIEHLQDDIRKMGGLLRYTMRCNKWINSLPKPLIVYRGLQVDNPDKWIKENIREAGRDLGVYWTNIFEVAINQNGPDGGYGRGVDANVVMVAEADNDAVDWYCTAAMQTVDSEEPEIRLIKGAQIKLKEVHILGPTSDFIITVEHSERIVPINKMFKV